MKKWLNSLDEKNLQINSLCISKSVKLSNIKTTDIVDKLKVIFEKLKYLENDYDVLRKNYQTIKERNKSE